VAGEQEIGSREGPSQILISTQKQVQDSNKRRVKVKGYKKGDYVMVKNFDSTVLTARKVIPKHKGPYKIAKAMRNDRFLLEDVDG